MQIQMPSYLIHDNGDRPFRVTWPGGKATEEVKRVEIYKKSTKDDEEDDTQYSKLVAHVAAHDVYIGKSSATCDACDHSKRDAHKFHGNTILLHMIGRDYVYIGDKIYAFSLQEGDEFEAYYSPVGNNDVPYPVLVGKENVYFMLDKKYVPREHFPTNQNWEDAYSLYYGSFDPQQGWKSNLDRYKKRFHSKQIHKRIW
jgi:hypothetical protein